MFYLVKGAQRTYVRSKEESVKIITNNLNIIMILYLIIIAKGSLYYIIIRYFIKISNNDKMFYLNVM